MELKECLKWDNKIISVDFLHQLVQKAPIVWIGLKETIKGTSLEEGEADREYSKWNLTFQNGYGISVYVRN